LTIKFTQSTSAASGRVKAAPGS